MGRCRGGRKSGVMTGYEGPLRMLQPKTFSSLLGLCGKDDSVMNSDYWNGSDDTNQKMQVCIQFALIFYIFTLF